MAHNKPYPEAPPPSLNRPRSFCPHCKYKIPFYQNIPVISWIFLRGKCSNCAAPIAIRYPFVEILTAVASAIVAWKLGFGLPMLAALLLTWCLIVLAFIDIDHQLLLDDIVLPLIWVGLFCSTLNLFTDTHSAIFGAIAGYLSLWTVFHLFKLITGKEGMGHGDFKLLTALGAWFGWQMLPQIILIASLSGAVLGILLQVSKILDRGKPMPFGPYLAAAGWIAMLWGEQVNSSYLRFLGH